MAKFVLLLRDNGSWAPDDLSAEEIQNVIGRYRDWIESMRGKGEKLRDGEGRTLSRASSKVSVTDGPYTEKEVVGGFVIVEAKDYDEVVRLCENSPQFEFGSIEIREVQPT
jgi:hypothetical protein